MALASHLAVFPLILAYFSLLITSSYSFNPKLLNVSKFDQNYSYGWNTAGATWYGSPTGAGTDGGACGYGEAVKEHPYSSMVSAGGPSIYQSGEGCGICYEVKCSDHDACSGDPVTVTIIDECPGCTTESAHFDLSGTAFGALAKPNLGDELRNFGVLQVQFRRVDCSYPGVTIVVRVDPGSNSFYFATAIEYVDGDGIKSAEIQQQYGEWQLMEQSWGSLWKLDSSTVLQPPFSLRLTSLSGQTIVMSNVIPVGWQPGQAYRSHVNFDST